MGEGYFIVKVIQPASGLWEKDPFVWQNIQEFWAHLYKYQEISDPCVYEFVEKYKG